MIVGIDPGLSGAMFFMDSHTSNGEAIDLPVHVLMRGGKAKRELDIAQLIGILALRRINHAFIEQVGAMPGQGVSSTFAFGKTFGVIRCHRGAQHPDHPCAAGPVEACDGRDQKQGRVPSARLPADATGRTSVVT